MQKESYPGTFQEHQHPQDSPRKLQGQGPQKQSNRDYLSLPVPPHKLHQCIYCESGRSLGDRVKEHFKAPHTPPQCHHRTPHGLQPVQHSTQGGQQPLQEHQGGHVHMCTGPHP